MPPPPTAPSGGWSGRGRGGFRFPPEQTASGGRCSIYIIDQTGTMQFAEVRLPTPPPAPSAPEANQSTLPSAP